jgi:multiple sugar transport system ATP-binding protein
MATVRFDLATRVYAANQAPAVNRLTLDIQDGEMCVFVGPSGSGKSTALRMLAGLEHVDDGAIFIGDRDVTDLEPKERDIAMVFQNYALYPHMTVRQNMGFALRMAKYKPDDIARRVDEAAALLELEPYLDRRPKALSGGQRQRVAMGRAIVREPQVFLMDEPLSNLDAKLRVSTRTQISSLQRRLGITTVYVTHDQVEAMTMGDRVAVLKDGVLQQFSTPIGLYDQPANVFVAGFIGSPAMNLLPAIAVTGGVLVLGVTVPTQTLTQPSVDSRAILGVRSEDLYVDTEAPAAESIALNVDLVEELGSDAYVYGTVEGSDTKLVARTAGRQAPARGQQIRVRIRPDHVHVFDEATGVRL